jgi:hypothetical protein
MNLHSKTVEQFLLQLLCYKFDFGEKLVHKNG